jgi:hypothetical protein
MDTNLGMFSDIFMYTAMSLAMYGHSLFPFTEHIRLLNMISVHEFRCCFGEVYLEHFSPFLLRVFEGDLDKNQAEVFSQCFRR